MTPETFCHSLRLPELIVKRTSCKKSAKCHSAAGIVVEWTLCRFHTVGCFCDLCGVLLVAAEQACARDVDELGRVSPRVGGAGQAERRRVGRRAHHVAQPR